MATVASRHPMIICAESIAALHLLHVVPARPSSNLVTNVQSRSAGYTLSFEKERDLSSTLAFLAYVRDNNNNIPAVCIEEDANTDYLNVLLAINQSNRDQLELAPVELNTGFGRIFTLLSQADGTKPKSMFCDHLLTVTC